MFTGLQITKDPEYRCQLVQLSSADLPEGEVEIAVEYSTINYKDALAITGKSPVVRNFPLTPGIDLAGKVTVSSSPNFKAGDAVVLNGWGVGEVHSGGLAQKARLKADWLIPLPPEFTSRQAMILGTAGYTAMLCVMALEEQGVKPEDGEVLVTGATGGVGSVAVALLAKLGYQVVASTGKPEEADYLKQLGAQEIINRDELNAAGRPLAKERWAGAVDTLGSHTLANVCASTKYAGTVAACGLAQGMDLPATVAPFILRGVKLIGVDSVYCPQAKRLAAWQRLAELINPDILDSLVTEISLEDCLQASQELLAGKVKGRLLVNLTR